MVITTDWWLQARLALFGSHRMSLPGAGIESSMASAVLFDLDQTLIDRTATLEAYLPDQYERFTAASELDRDRYVRRFLELDRNGYAEKSEFYRVLRAEFGFTAQTEVLVEDFRSNCFARSTLFAGALETLTELREQGSKLAIVTNGSSRTQRTKIEATGLEDLVDAIVVSGEVGFSKPDQRIFEIATDSLGVQCGECVFVGDNPERDIVGACGAGMSTIWVSHGETWPARLCVEPHRTIVSISELRQRG
jgi:putative hydrolase of the HAD superfamily